MKAHKAPKISIRPLSFPSNLLSNLCCCLGPQWVGVKSNYVDVGTPYALLEMFAHTQEHEEIYFVDLGCAMLLGMIVGANSF